MVQVSAPVGYGTTTKVLHWLTVALLLAQFTVGYLMDDEGGGGRGRGRGEGSGRGRGRGGEEGLEAITLLPLHVTLGVAVLLLAIVRVGWRRRTGLPPWAEQLSDGQRRVAHLTEVVLLVCLFAIPVTGLLMVLRGDDDLLFLHVTTHVLFFAALAVHLALVLGKRLLPRMV